jgi:predicted nucleic acid-binding protein
MSRFSTFRGPNASVEIQLREVIAIDKADYLRTYLQLKLVIDTSALLAVMLNEPQRPAIVAASQGCNLVASDILPFEVGNALTAMVRRMRLDPDEVLSAWTIFGRFPISLSSIDISSALKIALRHRIYAYDAYVMQCAVEQRAELLTLDQGMRAIAVAEGITLRGVQSP